MDGRLELEWRSLEPADSPVLTGSDHPEGPHLSVVDGVDGLAVARDRSHGGARVPQEDMAEPRGEEEQRLGTNKSSLTLSHPMAPYGVMIFPQTHKGG